MFTFISIQYKQQAVFMCEPSLNLMGNDVIQFNI